MRKTTVAIVVMVVALLVVHAPAGNLNPPPGGVAPTGPTLQDVLDAVRPGPWLAASSITTQSLAQGQISAPLVTGDGVLHAIRIAFKSNSTTGKEQYILEQLDGQPLGRFTNDRVGTTTTPSPSPPANQFYVLDTAFTGGLRIRMPAQPSCPTCQVDDLVYTVLYEPTSAPSALGSLDPPVGGVAPVEPSLLAIATAASTPAQHISQVNAITLSPGASLLITTGAGTLQSVSLTVGSSGTPGTTARDFAIVETDGTPIGRFLGTEELFSGGQPSAQEGGFLELNVRYTNGLRLLNPFPPDPTGANDLQIAGYTFLIKPGP